MKRILLLWLSLLCLTTQAQDMGAIREGFIVDKFPKVSFMYHNYAPQVLTKSDFQYLKEGGEERNFDLVVLPENHSQKQQITLFLWEDMAHNGRGQFDFTQKTLSDFFNETNITAKDEIAIAVFNRRKNTPSTLKILTDGFTSDKFLIKQAIRNYQPSRERYPEFPNRSNMYSAIREGLDMLQPMEGAKSIVVFTSGYSMKNSGSDSEAQVLLQAQRLHIPVYIIQYYYKSGVAPESEGFAKSTNGTFGSYMDVASAKVALNNIYSQIRDRYFGHNYKISFKSDAKRGDEARIISLKVKGEEELEQLIPPSFSLKDWIKNNVWWFVGIVLFILALIGLSIWLISSSAVRRKKKMAKLKAGLQDQISASDLKFEDLKRKQESQERKRREEEAQKANEAEQERLENLMRTKNLYPRLQCCIGNDTFNYTINKPRITLGRGKNNDVVLNNDKVSRHHAEIIFTGGGFEIIDNKSTNKVIINGAFFERATLKSGDIICIGEAVITFYV
ncbi:MAG: FHA domain-containing protein [Bacteroidales bacterium]|jgi:hypothetical protein|nr:FHA domain-containing protein [Bacteroidales bacterium]